MRAAAGLVWALSARHLAAHRARLLLSAVGVAAGVSLAIGVSSLGSSIEASLSDTARSAASRANIEVRPAAGRGLDPAMTTEIRGFEGIRAAGAAVESFTRMRHEGRLADALVLGMDPDMADLAPASIDPRVLDVESPALEADPIFGSGPWNLDRLYELEDPFAELTATPFGLYLSRPLADELGAVAGDRVQVASPSGWSVVEVSGIAPEAADASTPAAVGLLATVQDLMGRGPLVDVIYVEAGDPSRALDELRAAIGDRARVGPVAFRESDIGQLMSGATILVSLAGVVALFVGAFLVYNTMSMAAVERSTEAALIRAIGGRRRQVFGLHLAEGAGIGVVGASIGLLGGLAVARLMLTAQGSGVQDMTPVPITSLALRPRDMAVAWTAGVLAAIAASWLPARRVARADPVEGLGPVGTLEDGAQVVSPATIAVGLGLLGAGAATITVLMTAGRIELVWAGLTVALGGVALLIRPGIPAVAGLLLRPMSSERSRAPGIVRLAAGEVLRSPGRTAFTVGAILLAMSVVIGVSLGTAAFRDTFRMAFDEILRADLYVRSETWRPFGSDVPMDASIIGDLERVEGVAFAYPFRVGTTAYEGRSLIVIAFDFDAYAQLPGMSDSFRDDAAEQARILAEPGTILAAPSVQTQLGLQVGDDMVMPSVRGPVPLRIVGTMADPSAFTPTVFMDFSQLRELWDTDAADVFPLALEPGADPGEVRDRIMQELGPRYQLEVDTQDEYVARVNSIVASVLGVVSSLLLVVVLTAGLGLANTLIISTLERRRDLGVLRAVGMQRRQVRRMVGAEAVIVGVIGTAIACVLGTGLGYLFTLGSQAQIGVPVAFQLRPEAFLQAGVLGIAGALAASLYPAWRAARVDVVEALQYE